MDLILTHEQTDLDGLASMLGAHILRPEAIALLPRQINRNGKAFLRRYANDLPFRITRRFLTNLLRAFSWWIRNPW